MQISQALKIVQALADGADPNTGEIFPEGTVYQRPQVIRALLTAVKVMEVQDQAEKRNRRSPTRAGLSWDKAEDKLPSQRFDERIAIAQLAKLHERTRGAILSRLERLGKLQPDIR